MQIDQMYLIQECVYETISYSKLSLIRVYKVPPV